MALSAAVSWGFPCSSRSCWAGPEPGGKGHHWRSLAATCGAAEPAARLRPQRPARRPTLWFQEWWLQTWWVPCCPRTAGAPGKGRRRGLGHGSGSGLPLGSAGRGHSAGPQLLVKWMDTGVSAHVRSEDRRARALGVATQALTLGWECCCDRPCLALPGLPLAAVPPLCTALPRPTPSLSHSASQLSPRFR